jgi:hypothetical protein
VGVPPLCRSGSSSLTFPRVDLPERDRVQRGRSRATAGQPGRYTGTYGQGRVDWTINRQLSFALEAVYFRVSDVIERAGGQNSRYLGVELAYGW